MGQACCGSAVPEVILDDPIAGEEHKFLCKKAGLFSSDYEVFKDFDDKQKWLFIDKKGNFWDNPKYFLEDYRRPDKQKFGNIMCAATITEIETKKYDVECHEDSDASDGYSDSSEDDEDVQVVKMKWVQKMKVKFYKDREMDNKWAELKVKAKGKAKKITTTTEHEDADGNAYTTESVNIKKKVKKLLYAFEYEEEKEEKIDIVVEGKLNGPGKSLQWTSNMFSGTCHDNKAKLTSNYKEPGLALLVGFICTVCASPDDIADHVVIW